MALARGLGAFEFELGLVFMAEVLALVRRVVVRVDPVILAGHAGVCGFVLDDVSIEIPYFLPERTG